MHIIMTFHLRNKKSSKNEDLRHTEGMNILKILPIQWNDKQSNWHSI